MPHLDPKRLLLVDAAGAGISAFLLGLILVRFNGVVGIPVRTLYLLAAIPLFFAVIDAIGYRSNSSPAIFLRGIAVLNSLYCVLSLSLTFSHRDTVTTLGWIYIVIEVSIVLSLALTQWRAGLKATNVTGGA